MSVFNLDEERAAKWLVSTETLEDIRRSGLVLIPYDEYVRLTSIGESNV